MSVSDAELKDPSCAESTSSSEGHFEDQGLSLSSVLELAAVQNPELNISEMMKPVALWSVNDVSSWVEKIPFPVELRSKYASLFANSAVHGPLLLQLDEELLRDIGVTKKIHIRRFLTDIDILKHSQEQTSVKLLEQSRFLHKLPSLVSKTDKLYHQQNELMDMVSQLQHRFDNMPYWNRVRMVEKLGLADTESISRHFEDLEDGARLYPSIYVNCEKSDHIIIGDYTCRGKLYGKPFYVKNTKQKKILLYYRSDLDKRRWRFTRTNKHSLVDFCEKRKYQARTQHSCDYPAAHKIPKEKEWAVWDGRTDHSWWVTIDISSNQPYLSQWVANTYYGGKLTPGLTGFICSFVFVPGEETGSLN